MANIRDRVDPPTISDAKDRLTSSDAALKVSKIYKDFMDALASSQKNEDGSVAPMPPEIASSYDYIKDQASQYDDIFKKQAVDKDILSNYESKYDNNTIYGTPTSTGAEP